MNIEIIESMCPLELSVRKYTHLSFPVQYIIQRTNLPPEYFSFDEELREVRRKLLEHNFIKIVSGWGNILIVEEVIDYQL